MKKKVQISNYEDVVTYGWLYATMPTILKTAFDLNGKEFMLDALTDGLGIEDGYEAFEYAVRGRLCLFNELSKYENFQSIVNEAVAITEKDFGLYGNEYAEVAEEIYQANRKHTA